MFTIGKLSIIEIQILPNLMYIFNTMSIKVLESYFGDIDKPFVTLLREGKRPRRVHTVMKKENKVGGLKLCDFKTI